MKSFLIIQTAFIGDVVLSTALIEKIHIHHPDASVDFLVRKGNEQLLKGHPYLREVLVWDKKKNKYPNLFRLLKKIRKNRYSKVINVQRFMATGILTAFSGAEEKIGFDKNPLSFLFTRKIKHDTKSERIRHEVERNNDLISEFTDDDFLKPRLYPTTDDENAISEYTEKTFVTFSPASVWATKKMPFDKWVKLIDNTNPLYKIYLLGGPENREECKKLVNASINKHVEILAGKLNMLESVALMKRAYMNFTHDSAPLHFCSAVNAPVTAIFCSTDISLGYTPLSDNSRIVQSKEPLPCKPCGSHGKKTCPLGHFKCGNTIDTEELISIIN